MNPYDHYRKVATETADPVELVIMLYRGAINFLAGAEQAMHAGDPAQSHRLLIRAQLVVAELMGTLDLDAGEIALNLNRLYDYMQRQMIEANLRKDPAPAAEVRRMLVELLGTWEDIAQQQAAHGSPRAASQIAVA